MKHEMMEALMDAFCNELHEIKVSLDNNGGHFSCDREIRNAAKCVRAVHDMEEMTAMSAKAALR